MFVVRNIWAFLEMSAFLQLRQMVSSVSRLDDMASTANLVMSRRAKVVLLYFCALDVEVAWDVCVDVIRYCTADSLKCELVRSLVSYQPVVPLSPLECGRGWASSQMVCYGFEEGRIGDPYPTCVFPVF